MRSTRPASCLPPGGGGSGWGGSQAGVSLVESLVAAGLLGIAAVLSSRHALRDAQARCLARAEMEAVLGAPWIAPGGSYPAPDGVSATAAATTEPGLEQVTVSAATFGPDSYTLSAMKAQATSGSAPIDGGKRQDIAHGCPPP